MVYLFLADGFEEIEALTAADILRRAGIDVKTVSVSADLCVTGAHSITVAADILAEEADITAAEAVILPGGMPGTLNLQKSSAVRDFVMHCAEKGKYVCAICAAPSVLGSCGILEGKTVACYPGFEDKCTGAEISFEPVCVCGNIVTSRGPGTAAEFAYEIVRLMKSAEAAERLKRDMIYA